MDTAVVTGAAGLIGSETVRLFAERGFRVLGIENNMRKYFFGEDGSVQPTLEALRSGCRGFVHVETDIRDYGKIAELFKAHAADIRVVIHTAAQPSHDWAAREPFTDFTVNANGTLNLLEATRQHCPEAVFIFTSTNKVYGDTPNRLPLVEQETRWELDPAHPYAKEGIDETMSIDASKHSLFGASKVAADVLAQEYGRYFGMKTVCFRGGCLTGPQHAGAELHGFLAYLMRCAATGRPYRIFGYKGKQVRDNIHSRDLVEAFYRFYEAPRCGEVYNIGGARFSNCSLLEAVALSEEIVGRKMNTEYAEQARAGDHMWWISDVTKFKEHYPRWALTRNIPSILEEIYALNRARWAEE